MNLSERDLLVNWHPYTQMKNLPPPISITRGEGAYLFDEEGNQYLDAVSSWWVNTHGHAHPHIASEVSKQLNTLEHVIFAGFTHPKAVELSERLLQALPNNMTRVFYSDNGSTAVEVAQKMAIQYWGNQGEQRHCFIAFKDAYHGDTFGAMSVSGRGAFVKPFEPLLFDVAFIDPPIPGKEEDSVNQLKSILENRASEMAAFIFEPLVQGAAGMVMHSAEALDQLISLCHDNKVLCIADEVMTGFGRTGRFLATDHCEQRPDIICLSKGITGGTMALSATVCTQAVYEAFLSDDKGKTLFHGHSYTANPVACAAACASMDIFDKTETWRNIERIGDKHMEFSDSVKDHRGIRDIRQQGTILAIELETGDESSYFNARRDEIYAFFMAKKLLLRPLGNVVYILPPYCITDEDLDTVYEAITELLNSFFPDAGK